MKQIMFAAIVLIFLGGNIFGQYCIGGTKYTLRDDKGDAMKKKHLKDLKVLGIDGGARKLGEKRSDHFLIFYKTLNGNRTHRFEFKKSLTFYFGYCNQIRDLTLGYKKLKMKLIFDIGILNSNLNIQALPFQNGTFRLRSIKCSDGKGLPMTDNENRGFCNVASTNWEKVSDGILETDKECCKKKARFGYWYPK